MEYLVNNTKYSFSYKELKQTHLRFCDMDDAEFRDNLPDALHLACVICFLKETPTYICLSDEGIIHQLTHLVAGNEGPSVKFKPIRELFKQQLELA